MAGGPSPSEVASARETVEAYYRALRRGDPLGPFFADEREDVSARETGSGREANDGREASGGQGDDQRASARGPAYVKFGISERLDGSAAIRNGLRRQTETTADWHVDSRDLRVSERADHAWFADAVAMAWTDVERGIRYEFDTRWSGTLERRPDATTDAPGDWRFVGMHVSTAGDLS
ncbi:MAG: nuclear transport factor 2 family protein [Haloarculaceae archaeon]